LNGTYQLLAYADDVNLLEDNTDNKIKNAETLIVVSTVVGLEMNVGKTRYMLSPLLQNSGPNREIEIANRSFEMCHSSNIWERQ
jgi:hypothetical protein